MYNVELYVVICRMVLQRLIMTQIVAAVFLRMFVVFMAAISQNLGVIEMAISLVVTPLVSTFTRKIDNKYVDAVFLCFNKK